MSFKGGARQVAEKMMATEEGREQLEFADRLRRGKADDWLIRAFGQPFGGWDPGQLAYLYRLWEFWVSGELAVGRLYLGHTPEADRERDANQESLNALSLLDEHPDQPGFSARVDFDQTVSPHGDGWLSWSNPIKLGMFVPGHECPGGPGCEGAWAHIEPQPAPRGVPLEIGSTDTMTTYMHLLEGVGVARWPYGSERVVLLVSSTWVRECELAADPQVRWKPEPMWRPSFAPDAAQPALI